LTSVWRSGRFVLNKGPVFWRERKKLHHDYTRHRITPATAVCRTLREKNAVIASQDSCCKIGPTYEPNRARVELLAQLRRPSKQYCIWQPPRDEITSAPDELTLLEFARRLLVRRQETT
jgi:hypothetical protein